MKQVMMSTKFYSNCLGKTNSGPYLKHMERKCVRLRHFYLSLITGLLITSNPKCILRWVTQTLSNLINILSFLGQTRYYLQICFPLMPFLIRKATSGLWGKWVILGHYPTFWGTSRSRKRLAFCVCVGVSTGKPCILILNDLNIGASLFSKYCLQLSEPSYIGQNYNFALKFDIEVIHNIQLSLNVDDEFFIESQAFKIVSC